jgi:heterotetrameric sarcosine oxidase gamma subunit
VSQSRPPSSAQPSSSPTGGSGAPVISPARRYRVSAMHAAHVALGASFREEGDWRVPEAYGRPADEAARAQAGVGLADASACGKLLLRGDAIDALLVEAVGIERLPDRAVERVRVNGARTLSCRLAEDELLLLAPPGEGDIVAEVLDRAAGSICVHLTDMTSGLAVLDLLGPRARDLLARLSPLDLGPLAPLAVVQGALAHVHAILVRLDRPDGYRALVAREYGAFVWDTLAEAGRDLGLVPVGAAARALLEGE